VLSFDLFLFGLLGHGGARTAEYLKNNLFKNLVSHDDFISDTKKAIGNNETKFECSSSFFHGICVFETLNFDSAVEVFKQTDEEYLIEEAGQPKNAGSTAATAFLIGDKLIVANVGDSRVVASRNGSGLIIVLSRFI